MAAASCSAAATVVEKLVDFGEAADRAQKYRVRWLGYEANEDTW
jgi:hypothetical protein